MTADTSFSSLGDIAIQSNISVWSEQFCKFEGIASSERRSTTVAMYIINSSSSQLLALVLSRAHRRSPYRIRSCPA